MVELFVTESSPALAEGARRRRRGDSDRYNVVRKSRSVVAPRPTTSDDEERLLLLSMPISGWDDDMPRPTGWIIGVYDNWLRELLLTWQLGTSCMPAQKRLFPKKGFFGPHKGILPTNLTNHGVRDIILAAPIHHPPVLSYLPTRGKRQSVVHI